MNNSFVLGLGLAAIDGLTSAFVAMLILALAVIGTGSQGGSDTTAEQAILGIKRPPLNLLVRVSPDCSGERVPLAPVVGVDNSRRLVEIESFTRHGSVYWTDVCGSSSCTAQLIVNNGLYPRPWCIDLAIANTPQNFRERSTGPTKFEVVLATPMGDKALPEDLWEIDGCWHSFQFSAMTKFLEKKGKQC